jgi:L-lactate dehydrogenase complex protein LldF
MTQNKKQFIRQAEKVAFDLDHRRKIQFNLGKYFTAVEKGLERYADFEKARDQAASIKDYVINNIDSLLEELVNNMRNNGIEVYLVDNDKDVLDILSKIITQEKVKLVVKSKSMTTEEVGLNEFLSDKGIEVLETDLGEFIVQQAGEKPYHIVTPAMHKSRHDVAKLYHEKFGTPPDADPTTLTSFTRQYLREKFVKADLGITGANFFIADEGAIALTENEGNAFMSFSFPRVHVAIAGFEKIIPSYRHLSLMWQVLANRGTGQSITVYNSIVRGPRRDNEDSGPDRMIVILFDNGRSRLLQSPEHRLALKCIRCGACLNYCPI